MAEEKKPRELYQLVAIKDGEEIVTLDDEAGTIVYGKPKSVAVNVDMLNEQ